MILLPPQSNLKGNELKDFIQKDIVNYLAKLDNLILEAGTGFGKTNTALQAINRIRKNNDEPIVILVPTDVLKQQWLSKINHDNVFVYVIKSYTNVEKEDIIRNGYLLIVDEAHRILNQNSQYFSLAIDLSDFKFNLFLSATLENNHKKFLHSRGFNNYYEISLNYLYNNGLVPDFININLAVQFTEDEKLQVVNVQEKIDKWLPFMKMIGVNNVFEEINLENQCFLYGEDYNKIKRMYWGLRACYTKRNGIYKNAINKFDAVKTILEHLIDEKVLVFCSNIDTVNDIVKLTPQGIGYHSKITSKNRKEIINVFNNDYKKHLISVGSLIEGFDSIKPIRFGVRFSYDSTSLKGIQSLGRIIRFDETNPDSKAYMFNLYVDDFVYNKNHVESIEKRWLLNNQKDLINIINIENMEEIEW